jgi:hypothetical protein
MSATLHDSMALFHSALFAVIVSRSPIIINASRARVHMTFSLLGSSTNPISLSVLQRTVLKMMISLSRPWKESIVKQGVDRLFKACACFVYGVKIVTCRSLLSFLDSSLSLGRMRATSLTCSSLLFDLPPMSSSPEHWTKTAGKITPPIRGQGNSVDSRRASA